MPDLPRTPHFDSQRKSFYKTASRLVRGAKASYHNSEWHNWTRNRVELPAPDDSGTLCLSDHVAQSGDTFVKLDKLINPTPNDPTLEDIYLSERNSLAHDFMNRCGHAPLSINMLTEKLADRYFDEVKKSTEKVKYIFTATQSIKGREISQNDKIKADDALSALVYIVQANDVLDKENKILHNVAITDDKKQKAFDLYDGKPPPAKPALSRKEVETALNMPFVQIAAEIERARAHSHRRILNNKTYTPEQKVELARRVDQFADGMGERLNRFS